MTHNVENDAPLWWVIDGDAFRDALHRAHAGEDPEVLYVEQYANSDVTSEEPRTASEVVAPRRTRYEECGFNVADGLDTIAVVIDPTIDKRGYVDIPPYGDVRIVLREPNERVLLHEFLHVLVGRVLGGAEDHHHALVNMIEVGLTENGWGRA